jgi:hypothetical protein
MQPLVIHPRRSQSDIDAKRIDQIYAFADALKAADKALAAISYGKRPSFDELADKPTYLGDMGDLAKQITVIADAWQDEIDNAPEEN